MLRQIKPGLRGFNIVSNSVAGCISNTPEKLSWTPEVSFLEIVSQPGMFLQKFIGTKSLKQLKCFTNTHSNRHFNKQVDMVNSNMQLINFESMPISSLPNKKLAIHPDPIEFQRVSCVLTLPNKMEGILPEAMLPRFQIHFFAPDSAENFTAHAKSINLVHGDIINPLDINRNQELNLLEGRIPPMFESMGILRQM